MIVSSIKTVRCNIWQHSIRADKCLGLIFGKVPQGDYFREDIQQKNTKIFEYLKPIFMHNISMDVRSVDIFDPVDGVFFIDTDVEISPRLDAYLAIPNG